MLVLVVLVVLVLVVLVLVVVHSVTLVSSFSQVSWSADSRLLCSGSSDSTLKVSVSYSMYIHTCTCMSHAGVECPAEEAAAGLARPC